jgi:hypothetical protein
MRWSLGLCVSLLMMVGPEKAVAWTKPADVPFNPEDPVSELGSAPFGEFPVVFFNGHRQGLSPGVASEIWKALITHQGREHNVTIDRKTGEFTIREL